MSDQQPTSADDAETVLGPDALEGAFRLLMGTAPQASRQPIRTAPASRVAAFDAPRAARAQPTMATLDSAAADPAAAGAARGAAARPRGGWSETCLKCGGHVPQRADAAVCDFPGCVQLACLRCHPDVDAMLACEAHAGRVTRLQPAAGAAVTVAAAVDPVAPPVPSDTARPWYEAVSTVLASAPPAAAAGMQRAHRYLSSWLRWIDVPVDAVDEWAVCSFVLARCAPVVGEARPAALGPPVAPATAAGDLSALRRRARLLGDTAMLDVLCHETVVRLVGMLTANTTRKKSAKRPILIAHVREVWERLGAGATRGQVRDAALLTVGLLAGLRRREIVALTVGDAVWDAARRELTLTVRRDKVNTNIIDAQAPRTIVIAHPLLDMAWPRYTAAVGDRDAAAPLFPRLQGMTVTGDALAAATVNTIVRSLLPGAGVTPHSLRVGCATELFAAGVDTATIMELGRWSSYAALLYVLPSADRLAAATRAMDDGVGLDRVLMQREFGAGVDPHRVARRTA